MNILIIGGGGREHAIAWKLAQSRHQPVLYLAPGNPGTEVFGKNVSLNIDVHEDVIRFCKDNLIDLVVVGPEKPLADGLSDALALAGISAFGPQKGAAQIEASKVFSKNFMARHGIPTARYATFTKLDEASRYLSAVDYPIVIKASGLAAGKGVILPETFEDAKDWLEKILRDGLFGEAGEEVVIEERLTGPEVSLMAFTDGKTVIPMPAAQDHKRVLDGDGGANTGGMGAYAPADIFTSDLLDEVMEYVLKPAISGLRLEGTPFQGVLYAGLMLTDGGVRVLEFNCRFGDPETQVILPLLETDLLEIMSACVEGRLDELVVRWKNEAAVCVVLASNGYPGKFETGKITHGSLQPYQNGICFHAGTSRKGHDVMTNGGRVFGVTAWANSLDLAIKQAYRIVNEIDFEGKYYRKDIAQSAVKQPAYVTAGVSIDAGNRAVDLMKEAVKATYTPAVLAGIGSFGGLFDASRIKEMRNPVLVASTDGVGTKVKLAAQAGRYRGIGHDIVNHCINDILVQGAQPLFFMDYFATSKLNPEQAAEVVTGIAEACKEAGMVLLGGETAEMPGVYVSNEFDLAGTIIGVLERESILPRSGELTAGDVIIGFASSGPHTNGYSLIRRVFGDSSLSFVFPEIGQALEDVLLVPHRSYLKIIAPENRLNPSIKALAHLTGGGFIENIPRILPLTLNAQIQLGSWPVPPLWGLIQAKGNIAKEEMYRVFNMGIGMIAIVDKAQTAEFRRSIAEQTWEIGQLIAGGQKVTLI